MRLDSLNHRESTPQRPKTTSSSSTLSRSSESKVSTATSRPSAASTARRSTASRLVVRAGPKPPAATAPTTTTAPAPAPRNPLRPKACNQNVLSLTASRSSITSRASRMPVGERPRQPQLSAAAKGINRTPLTPKVAAKATSIVTPLGKRTQNPSILAAQTLPKDDIAASTPPTLGAPFLGNNITPRSGQRQSRVDSTNTTPSGTPTADRISDGADFGRVSTGSSIPSLTFEGTRQSSSGESESGDSKFFYASDARSQLPQLTQRPATTAPQKPSTFFYANGTAEEKRRASPAAPLTSSQESISASKFFYASTPNLHKPGITTSGSNSTISSSSRAPLKRPSTAHSAMVPPSAPQRPVSPIKAASTPSAQTLRSSATLPVPQNQQNRAPISSPPSLAPVTNPTRNRGVTIDAGPKLTRGHSRTGSVPTLELLPAPRLAMSPSGSPEPVSPPLSPGLSQPAMTMASLLQAVEDLGEADEADGDAQPEPASPTKSIHSNDAISELVANARRERKVQDLEITNASLEAINRTLERQLRKQTAELRRYRRLSRSGRISLASMPSSRVTSATMTEPPDDLSDLDEDPDESEEEPDSFEESDFSGTESTSAPDTISPNDKMAARRKRDERRLQLDLTKHQELLVDSQKMNQSLKRCLNWTEVLIKEGQKALEYRVRVSDVQLGGHVLTPLDEDEEMSFNADVSFNEDVSLNENTAPPEEASQSLQPPWTKGAQDRDSGIELPVDMATYSTTQGTLP